jgi:hypothetical protein
MVTRQPAYRKRISPSSRSETTVSRASASTVSVSGGSARPSVESGPGYGAGSERRAIETAVTIRSTSVSSTERPLAATGSGEVCSSSAIEINLPRGVITPRREAVFP